MTVNPILKVAMFIDHENIFLGLKEINYGYPQYRELLEKFKKEWVVVFGKIYLIVDRKSSFSLFNLWELGLDPIYTPNPGRKSLCDFQMTCDIMELLFTNSNIELIVLLSGDKDFIPVLRKIAENGKKACVIGVGETMADALIKECNRLGYDYYDYRDICGNPFKKKSR